MCLLRLKVKRVVIFRRVLDGVPVQDPLPRYQEQEDRELLMSWEAVKFHR